MATRTGLHQQAITALLALILIFSGSAFAHGPGKKLAGRVIDKHNKPIREATVGFPVANLSATTDENGLFELILRDETPGPLVVFKPGFETTRLYLDTTKKKPVEIVLSSIRRDLREVEVSTNREKLLIDRLRSVEGTTIYASKKNDIIHPDREVNNKAGNNARQIYAQVSGLNVWESDNSGLQLDIGGRGLSPSRTANFNTRQNGYDISADPLGYPESYYTPPAEAIDRIELVRGAASLQYGTQFGGVLNFRLKDGDNKPLSLNTRVTAGSFGMKSLFQSVSAQKGKNRVYGFYHHRSGNGFRPHSGYSSHTAYLMARRNVGERSSLKLEYTAMKYLAEQPGGLTDKQFANDPYQSRRNRNYFRVQWHLPALTYHVRFSPYTDFTTRIFGLIANRDALGVLSTPDEADPAYIESAAEYEKNRDLLSDRFLNAGGESRLLHRYKLFNEQISALATGVRFFRGTSHKRQGFAGNSDRPEFRYLQQDFPGKLDYRFVNYNAAVFVENQFRISNEWSITPGVRYEYIETRAKGTYRDFFRHQDGNILYDTLVNENRLSPRPILLGGIGASYQPENKDYELYVNASQNFRSITYSDFRVDNRSMSIDPDLQDERGYNLDLGWRGQVGSWLSYDFTAFYLYYANRISLIGYYEPVRGAFRTNVGPSKTVGLESLVKWSPGRLWKWKEHDLLCFVNFSWLNGRYGEGKDPAITGKKVELVPDITFKTGITYRYKQIGISLQYTYVNDHYTDATNADFRNNPDAGNGVIGLVPSYQVADLSMSYRRGHWSLESGVNNVLNKAYFTRRATGYPGPGILPAAPRSVYLTVGFRL